MTPENETTDDSGTETERLKTCPECGSRRVITCGIGLRDAEHGYRCDYKKCRARFDEPDVREVEVLDEGPKDGLAAELLAADPDDPLEEVAAEALVAAGKVDDPQRIATDGGRSL